MNDELIRQVKIFLEGSDEPFPAAEFAPFEGPTSYWAAQPVEQTAARLIPQYHERLDRSNVRIVYFFRSDIPRKGGKLVFATTKKIMGLNAALAKNDDPFFCIVISHPVWEVLPQKHRDALVDHELCHCGVEVDEKGEVKLVLRNHDVQEFSEIVRRYGPWNPDVQEFLNAVLSAGKKPMPLLDGKSLAAGERPD